MSIITISRGIKSGGEKLANRLSEKLGYKCLGREIIKECARKYNIMEQDLLDELEAAPSLWQRLTKEHNRFLIYVQCSLLEAVKSDNLIYHGPAGQLFLNGIGHVLMIRLETPFADRVQTVINETGKDYKQAAEYLRKLDQQRERWVKLLYDEDWRDPSSYDLSVNLRHMSLDTVCDITAVAVTSDDFRSTKKSRRQLENISLACEVKAAIAADDKLWDQPITASADGGVVTLRGNVKNKKIRDLIVETASQVKGVNRCEVHIGLLSDPLPGDMRGHD